MKKAFSFWLILLCNLSDAFLYNQAKLCIVFFFCSLPISLITFSPIHQSGVAPAHWLKPFCSQVIFPLASSQTVQLTLLFDSISLCWVLLYYFKTILEQTVCVWYINGCELWHDHLTCCWVHSSKKLNVCSLCRECFSSLCLCMYTFLCLSGDLGK